MDDNKEQIQLLHKLETPQLRKENASIISYHYQTEKTNPTVFHFVSIDFKSPPIRLKQSLISHELINEKDIYLIDRYFTEEEGESLRNFSKQAHFKTKIFADQNSRSKGETPDRAMDPEEKWNFFLNPGPAIQELFKLLNWLADRLHADISTLPWEMYEADLCVPAVASNRVESKTLESMEMGKHQDYDTEQGIAFGIPILYSETPKFHFNIFFNGSEGKPWLVSAMLYSTSEAFASEYGLGTVFFDKNDKQSFCADAKHMRLVIFEGDIVHAIEQSKLPAHENIWRVSYVFKLLINPKDKNRSMKQAFSELMNIASQQK
ncbi:hypothetical protein [Candidatus Protochlamydia amoebophila]|uniref:Prolyl 4-hydroxylase alpha subunit Fe(2+) 2OG dioxygenase domain-containing protein n=1 Tax=Candidatus Protochlamydia amoebophila TaxID=362787 RepID=A0A0C1H3M6_9BACT|nr:hypothetical protein [Candidatus Protochlamydia amoebophila]KIC72134.1 hypothetical protein DB44_CO00040 [Candidatus Protochlamydia amoebophila]